MTGEFVSDERAAQDAMELADQVEAELLQRPATLEDLELLRLAYGAQARIEAKTAGDRRRLERQREHAAALDRVPGPLCRCAASTSRARSSGDRVR